MQGRWTSPVTAQMAAMGLLLKATVSGWRDGNWFLPLHIAFARWLPEQSRKRSSSTRTCGETAPWDSRLSHPADPHRVVEVWQLL